MKISHSIDKPSTGGVTYTKDRQQYFDNNKGEGRSHQSLFMCSTLQHGDPVASTRASLDLDVYRKYLRFVMPPAQLKNHTVIPYSSCYVWAVTAAVWLCWGGYSC